MAYDRALIDWVAEALDPFGPVASRPMMGGATLFCAGVPFGIVVGDALWLKADAESDAEWDRAGCARFTYDRAGRTATMNFRRAPDDVYDDAQSTRDWAALAIAAAERAPRRMRRSRRTT